MDGLKFPIYKNFLFKVFAYIEHGSVRVKTSGPMRFLVDRFTGPLVSIFEGEVPVRVTNDTLFFSIWIPPIPSQAFDRLVHNQIKNMVAQTLWKLGIPASTNPEQVTISNGRVDVAFRRTENVGFQDYQNIGAYNLHFRCGQVSHSPIFTSDYY
jgi:hypothetical protein